MVRSKYEVVEKASIEEYNIQATLYKHKKSGAQVISVAADDDNKVFGITFRTPPKDSTGIPHILEVCLLRLVDVRDLDAFAAFRSLWIKKIPCQGTFC